MDTLYKDMATADTVALKQHVRSVALAARDALSMQNRIKKSRIICERLTSMLDASLAQAGPKESGRPFTIVVYASFRTEVNLDQFISAAYSRGAHIAFPCMNRERARERGEQPMSMRVVSEADYERGDVPFICSPIEAFDVDEPVLEPYPLVNPNDVDMAVIPLVAFDKWNRRLGYGGGNYDSFLPQLREETLVVGVGFAEQRVGAVPCEPHDVTLPHIVSA